MTAFDTTTDPLPGSTDGEFYCKREGIDESYTSANCIQPCSASKSRRLIKCCRVGLDTCDFPVDEVPNRRCEFFVPPAECAREAYYCRSGDEEDYTQETCKRPCQGNEERFVRCCDGHVDECRRPNKRSLNRCAYLGEAPSCFVTTFAGTSTV